MRDKITKGLRYNSNKARFVLAPVEALSKLIEVYTKGAHKYSIYEDTNGNQSLGKDISMTEVIDKKLSIVYDGANNWRNGLSWTQAMDSVLRHIYAWLACEDKDSDLGTYHLSNATWGLMSLLTFIDSYPQGDDRNHWFKKPFKDLWLDIDGIIADYEKHFLEYLKLPLHHPTDWNDERFRNHWKDIVDDANFWATIPRILAPEEIVYPIAGYITSRPCSNELTMKWITDNGFPTAELINVYPSTPKSNILKDKPNVITVDDSIKNFVDYQSNNVTCFLMTRPHNAKYDVGHWRTNNMKELMTKLLVG